MLIQWVARRERVAPPKENRMRLPDAPRLLPMINRLAQDTVYWCGVSGWGVLGLFAALIGALGISARLEAYRQWQPAQVMTR
jgi:hypothetical protein